MSHIKGTMHNSKISKFLFNILTDCANDLILCNLFYKELLFAIV